MSAIRVDVPASLHAAADEFARESGLTVEQLVASALAEKVSALAGPGWLAARAARGDRVRFEEALRRVPDVEPEPQDQLPPAVQP
jgi:hypothetical protein